MKKLATAAIIVASFAASHAVAQNLTITVSNLTHGMAFTPILVAAHTNTNHLYDVGQKASSSLQAMAEGGNLKPLITDLGATATIKVSSNSIAGGTTDLQSATPLLAGASTTVVLNTDANATHTKLSVVSMLLPTNDAFMGLDAIDIPAAAGTYTYLLNAYDAGTEANNELIVFAGNGGTPNTLGIPNAPFVTTNGSGATIGVATIDNNKTVHVHRGALGDDNATGGFSDLSNSIHRWLNPVARVTVVVQ